MDNCLASLLLFVEIKQKSQEKNKKSQNLGKLMKQYVEMDKKDDTGTYIYFSLIFFHKIIFTKKKISWKLFHEKKCFTYLSTIFNRAQGKFGKSSSRNVCKTSNHHGTKKIVCWFQIYFRLHIGRSYREKQKISPKTRNFWRLPPYQNTKQSVHATKIFVKSKK